MPFLVWTLRFVVFLLLLAFALLNTGKVSLDYFFGTWTAPLALVLLLVFVVGALLGAMVCAPIVFGQRQQLRRLQASTPPPPSDPVAEPPRLG